MPDGPSRPRPARVAAYYTGSGPQHKIAAAPCSVGLCCPADAPNGWDWGSVPNEASIRLSGPGVAGGRHGAQPRRSLSRGARSLRGGRRDVVTASFALDVRGARERSYLDRERPTRAVSSELGGDSGARGGSRAGVRPT